MTGLRAAVTLGLTGRYAVQARQARAGLELWAGDDHVELHVHDDAGSPTVAAAAYREFLAGDFDILLGPYGSGLVRRVAATVCGAHRPLWNHGGAADDLARPGLVSVPAPASTYLVPLLTLCRRRKVESVLLVGGSGPFARQVIEGAMHHAATMGVPVSVAELASWRVPASLAGRGLLIAATFDQDVEAVRRIRTVAVEVELVGCVAAGIHEFQARLGPLAEGVLAPAQWVNRDHPAEVGPTAAAFTRRFQARTGWIPDYPAAQAAATGWLAAEATRRRLGADEVQRWQTTTLLGAFALDSCGDRSGTRPWWSNGVTVGSTRCEAMLVCGCVLVLRVGPRRMNQASMPFDDDIVRRAKGPNVATLVTLLPDGQPQARRRHTGRPVPPYDAQFGGRSSDSGRTGAGAAEAALPC